jgi:Dolichyl-phosphate-mannose-protein mannosyltransferase
MPFPTPNSASLNRIVDRTIVVTTALAVLSIAVLYFLSFWQAMNCPISLTFEAHVLWSAYKLASGGNIYDLQSLTKEPWDVCIYTPLYPLLVAPIIKAVGPAFWAPRLITILSTIGSACAFVYLLRLSKRTNQAIAASLVFFLSFVPVWYTSLIAKSDFLALFLSMCALIAFLREENSPKVRHTWSAFLSTVAFLAKQQSVVVPLTILIYLSLKRQWKKAAQFAAVWVISMAIFALAIQTVTGGYLQHLSFLRLVKWQSANILLILSSIGFNFIALGLTILLIVYYVIRGKKKETDNLALPLILLGVTTALMSYSLGIPGAGSNHLVGIIFAISWLLCIALDCFPRTAPIFMLLAMLPCPLMYEFLQFVVTSQGALSQDLRSKLPKHISLLCEDPYWAMQTGSTPVIVDCVTFFNVWIAHPSMESALLKGIKEKSYGAIILGASDDKLPGIHIWPADAVNAVHENYYRVGEGTGNGLPQSLYLPKGR